MVMLTENLHFVFMHSIYFLSEMPTVITTVQTEIPSDRPGMSVNTMTTSTGSTNTITSSANDTDRPPTVQTTAADASSMNDVNSLPMNSMSTNPTMAERPPDTTSPDNQQTSGTSSTTYSNGGSSVGGSNGGGGGSGTTTNMYPNTVESTKMPGPPTMIMTTMDRFPTTSSTYGNDMPTNTDLSTNEVKPPTYPTIYMSSTKPDDLNYPYPPHYHNKYNYYHEIYPVYTYPMLYDNNNNYHGGGYTPSSGGGYAQNIPTLSYNPNMEFYGTTPTMSTSPYGGGDTRVPNTATTYMGNGWSNADEVIRRKQNGAKYPDRDNSGYNPEGKYNGTRTTAGTPATVPYIRTYFNPDDYITNAEAKSEYELTSMFDLTISHHIQSSSVRDCCRSCSFLMEFAKSFRLSCIP